jgi:hypothetical protein
MFLAGWRTTRVPAAVRSPRSWLSAMTALGVIGGGVAISRATESHWQVRMPLSRLGVDHGSAPVLTVTLVGLGLSMVALGLLLHQTFRALCAVGRLSPWAARLLPIGFALAGLAMAVTGVFPIWGSSSTIIHNVAGFTTPIVLMTTLVGARLALGSLGRRFDLASGAITMGVVVLFAATGWLHLMPYGLMELVCFGLIGGWLWLFEARLRCLLPDG